MIPKIINYCWFGKNEKPKIVLECIESWKKKCPGYEIIEWNEDNFDININNYVKEAYENKKWAFVSDYARLWILYNYGGIYLDTDVQLIKSLDETINTELFITSEDNKYIATGLGIGSKKNNSIIKKMMDDYSNIHFINDGKMDYTTCPVRNTNTLKPYLKDIDMTQKSQNEYFTYYPKQYFNPKDYDTDMIEPTQETIGIHLGMASWMKKRTKLKYKIHHFIKKIIGINLTKKIKKKLKK